jgi:hypothetical protein
MPYSMAYGPIGAFAEFHAEGVTRWSGGRAETCGLRGDAVCACCPNRWCRNCLDGRPVAPSNRRLHGVFVIHNADGA